MQQLTGLDTTFLVMEAGGQLGHVGSLCLYDPKDLRGGSLADAFAATLEARLHLLPPYRRRLVEVPLGLDRPYWIEDPNFDLDDHLRHIAVPPPGDDQQLAGPARAHPRPRARSRPPALGGVRDRGLRERPGRALHQDPPLHDRRRLGRGDDAGAARPQSGRRCGRGRGAERAGRGGAGALEMLGRGALGPRASARPHRAHRLPHRARSQPAAGRARRRARRRSASTACRSPAAFCAGAGRSSTPDRIPQTPAPHTPWNRSITPHRRFAFFSLPLARVKQVKERRRHHAQRRGDGALRRRTASLPAREGRAARHAARRHGARLRAERRAEGRVHQSRDHGPRRAGHRRREPGHASAPHRRRDAGRQAHAAGRAREPAPGLDAGDDARARRAGRAHRGAHARDGPACARPSTW